MKRTVLIAISIFCTALFFAEVKAPEVKAPGAPVRIEKISHWFEGVDFDHRTHEGAACADCHHTGFDMGAKCDGCHSSEKVSPTDIGLKDAYHKICGSCHIEKGKGIKEGCENCHKRKALPTIEKQG